MHRCAGPDTCRSWADCGGPCQRTFEQIRSDLTLADWILNSETPGVEPGLATRLIRDIPGLLADAERLAQLEVSDA